ncbi:hypothetical protein JHK82_028046 [Glycine max]|nr:hypothetical protein JHK86_028169 [Glycine max]KAG5127211.1 hypothetical protein JHK82_028046 [Glycine max]KAG5151823.1 hypothetical protein JHK84_028295 [Glycine max]
MSCCLAAPSLVLPHAFLFKVYRSCCCGRIMARAPDNIKSINGSKETIKLAIRITDLWFVGTPNRSEQAEMIIIDSHGDAIHVVCKQDQLKSWKADLMENYTYVMHNFKVMKNDGQFRICDHQYKLVFTGVTVVRQSDLEDLPFKKYKFADFTNVIVGLFQPELLVGSYAPSISNSLRASKLLINEAVFEIQEFRERLSDLGIQVRSVLTPGGHGSSQEGDVDLNVSPQALDKLLGYVLAFKVKVQPKFNNVVVLRYSNDSDLINVVVDMLPDAEACSKVHAPILDSDDPSQLEFQYVFVTADHDPLLGLPLTPTKRITSDDCDDEPKSSQISPAQLSSNKLARHDQIE